MPGALTTCIHHLRYPCVSDDVCMHAWSTHWKPVRQGETTRLRRKEGQVDYRFFPEPDLPPLLIDDAKVDAMKAALPELPEATLARLSRDYGIPEHLSRLIVCAAAGGASGALRVGVGVCLCVRVFFTWNRLSTPSTYSTYLVQPVSLPIPRPRQTHNSAVATNYESYILYIYI